MHFWADEDYSCLIKFGRTEKLDGQYTHFLRFSESTVLVV